MDNGEFRRRVAMPLLILVGLFVGLAVVVFSISRVLLAVPEVVATFTALAIAGYLLLVAALVSRYRQVTARALGGGLVLGLVALLAAGIVAAQAGMRELHEEQAEPGAEGEAAAEPGAEEPAAAVPEDAFVWVAVDTEFTEAPESLPAGEVTIALDNQGNLEHTVTFEEADVNVEAQGGEQATQTVTLDPGTYTYYCAVPGHRATMEGTVEVS